MLSNGHASMLIYALLHLSGYDLAMSELRNFRQLHSKTPGHPEVDMTPGVETTTGPLGQGISNAVGMALAEKLLAHEFNRPGHTVVDHRTYVLCGDGDLMEGISYEAAALAGHLGLGKLIVLYDSNDISLDGPTSLTFTEDVVKRFEACGWQVRTVQNGDTDISAIDRAIAASKMDAGRPSLIVVKTTIGYGAPNKQGKESAHGAPLGEKEAPLARAALGHATTPPFTVEKDVYHHFSVIAERGKARHAAWKIAAEKWAKAFPELATEWNNGINLDAGTLFEQALPAFKPGDKIPTRKASGMALNAVAKHVPWLVGGDADLSCSTLTAIENGGDFSKDNPAGRNIRFGVREHAMGAIANGIACHGGLRPYTATFFSFVDYMRPAVRLASLCKLPVIFIFTHDSLAVGEDGPTHQPVEQLASIRCIPGLTVIRPSDATEVNAAWELIMRHTGGPVALILSRQALPVLDRTALAPAEELEHGAYLLSDAIDPRATLIATGSEVALALDARRLLAEQGIAVRVVSMPSQDLFDRQDTAYRERILPRHLPTIAIEAGSTSGWHRYVGDTGLAIGVDRFGASGPGDTVMAHFGFTAGAVAERVKDLLSH
ncbi:MAG TPA: transketolase [bacterium]|nr:transketolase [bacterium]